MNILNSKLYKAKIKKKKNYVQRAPHKNRKTQYTMQFFEAYSQNSVF